MNKSFLLLVRRAAYNLRGGFLVRPLAIALTLGCAGALLSTLEEAFPSISDWVPRWLFPSHADPQVAQVILAGIGGSIMTVVSIVFAILLMTLTLASMQFSPRIIVSFSRDRVTQWTLGIFLGTFSYCMAALPAARSQPHPFAPVGRTTQRMRVHAAHRITVLATRRITAPLFVHATPLASCIHDVASSSVACGLANCRARSATDAGSSRIRMRPQSISTAT